jgi:peptide/nickel transport system substrate-binding protein
MVGAKSAARSTARFRLEAVSAARAVIQTGEYDFAWSIQVEDEVLLRLENGGKGKTVYAVGSDN